MTLCKRNTEFEIATPNKSGYAVYYPSLKINRDFLLLWWFLQASKTKSANAVTRSGKTNQETIFNGKRDNDYRYFLPLIWV